MRIGAHMSTAGGVVRAVERAILHDCEALQIFAKNNARWSAKPIDPMDAHRFRDAVDAAGLAPVVSHASYLINLAAPDGGPGHVRAKSIEALIDELERARLLGLSAVVVHPGVAAADMRDDEAFGLVAGAIRAAFAHVRGDAPTLLLEHTAGQGRSIGHRFEHLAAILDRLDGSPRVGVCLDTCHLVAAGYDITTDDGYLATMAAFDRLLGFDRLKLIHANDSKRPLGSRLDRHEHIGDGHVGRTGFAHVLRDTRLTHLAMVIETHKTKGVCDNPRAAMLDPLDLRNLRALRELRRRRRQA